MTSVGITAEFNPFHNGHMHLLHSVRALEPNAVVCVMSGNFVQRGYPAGLNKWARAAMAVSCGADLVVELPFYYAVNGAESFAAGSLAVMKGLGLTHIAFGSESGNAGQLLEAAQILSAEPELFQRKLKELLASGVSYPKAYEAAASCCGVEGYPGEDRPNDLLALEYLKQNIRKAYGLSPVAVLRRGASHDGGKVSGQYASASFIRGQSRVSDASLYMPEAAYEIYSKQHILSSADEDRFFDLIRYRMLDKTRFDNDLFNYGGDSMRRRIYEACVTAASFDEMIKAVKTKKQTYSSISRMLVRSLILDEGPLMDIEREIPVYARVLAFNGKGGAFLSSLRKNSALPVISNTGSVKGLSALQRYLLDADIMASDVYSVICGGSIYTGSDRIRHPEIIG